MKVGIKKVHENEWLVHVGYLSIKLDRFSVEILNISLEGVLALQSGQCHSELTSYVCLASKMKTLDDAGIQLLLREVDNQDMFKFMMVANNEEVTVKLFKNMGSILARQLQQDMKKAPMPELDEAKKAIRRIVEIMFTLEASGKIQFVSEETQYI